MGGAEVSAEVRSLVLEQSRRAVAGRSAGGEEVAAVATVVLLAEPPYGRLPDGVDGLVVV